MIAYSDTVSNSRLTFHVVKMFGYCDTVRSDLLTATLFHCHCKRGGLYPTRNRDKVGDLPLNDARQKKGHDEPAQSEN